MKYFLILLVLSPLCSIAQTPIGEWSDLFNYNSGKNIASGTRYILYQSDRGVLAYDQSTGEKKKLSKLNGLSSYDISTLCYDKKSGNFVIGHKNGMIDFINNDLKITPFPDLARVNVVGEKSINHISEYQNNLYVATAYGGIIIDPIRKIVPESFTFNISGSPEALNEITVYNDSVYINVKGKLYNAHVKANLRNMSNWRLVNIPTRINIRYITSTPIGLLFCDYKEAFNSDSLYFYNNGSLTLFNKETLRVNGIQYNENIISITHFDNVEAYDINLNRLYRVYEYLISNERPRPISAFPINSKNIIIADLNQGIVLKKNDYDFEIITISGPYDNNAYDLKSVKNNLYIASGGLVNNSFNIYNRSGTYVKKDDSWYYFNRNNLDTSFDIININVNPKDESHFVTSSYGKGILEYKNYLPSQGYTHVNSTLQRSTIYTETYVAVGSTAFDENGDLWAANAFSNRPLHQRLSDGTWVWYNFPTIFTAGDLGKMIIDKNNNVWLVAPRGSGLIAFNNNKTPQNKNDDKARILKTGIGKGNLPSNDIYTVVEDKNGQIWVGTGKGVAVIYNSSDAFANSNDAQVIKIEQEGQIQLLLESETVTAIAVDGANRKWFGTQNGGIFLTSPDGTTQIRNFNTNNSPLPSNTIFSIAINENTGEVYVATEKGIMIYRGDAIEGKENFKDAYAFPNPVNFDFNGTIAITNLPADVDVKITDSAGNLVAKTKANGGMATWDGKNFENKRVSSGVYFVMMANSDGSSKYAAKIVVVN
jgi:hypothetical protein